MALGYNTYYALPRLTNYADALAHYNHVKPILRNEYETRPLGRRNQKWVSIWLDPNDNKTVHAGYGSGELSQRQTLISYHPHGEIRVHKRNRWSSASCNERMTRILGVEFKTHQYDTWVRASFYDNGQNNTGWLPLHVPRNGGNNTKPSDDRLSLFVKGANDRLTYTNYTYPVIHKQNRGVVNILKEPYQPFLTYARGLLKLQGNNRLAFSLDMVAEFFGWRETISNNPHRYANHPPQLRYGADVQANRAEVMALARSEDSQDRLKALIWMNSHCGYYEGFMGYFTELFLRAHRDEVFTVETVKTGALVKDRYRRYFIW